MLDVITSLIHLIKHVQNSHPQYLLLYSTPQVVQMSVSLIIELSNPIQRRPYLMTSLESNYITRIQTQQDQCMKYLREESLMVEHQKLNHNPQYSPEISIIFTRRSQNPNDKLAGQLCYPGGKLESQENDYSAALRETQQDLGFDLAQRTFSLGRLATNYDNDQTGEQSKMAVNLFFSPGSVYNEGLKLDKKKVDKVMYLPIQGLGGCKLQVYNDIKKPSGESQESIKLSQNDLQSTKTRFHDFETEKFDGFSWLILMNLLDIMNYQNNSNLSRIVQETKDAYKIQTKEESDLKTKMISMIYENQRLSQFFR